LANQKISQLTDGSPAQAADQYPINRAGSNFRINTSTVLTGAVASSLSLAGATSGTVTFTAPAIAGTSTNGVTMTNVLLGPNGAAATPVYSFSANTGSGLYNVAGDIGFSVASVERMELGTTQLFLNVPLSDFAVGNTKLTFADGTITATSTTVGKTGNIVQTSSGPVSGNWNNVNVTPVTVNANVVTDQNLMSISVPAGVMNRVGKTLRVYCSGVYSTPAASTATLEFKVKFGSLTLVDITTSANPGTVTNNKWWFESTIITQTAGASAVFESSGRVSIDLGAFTTSSDTIFLDANNAVSSSLDSTAAQTLQITVAFSAANASNSNTQRQMVIDSVN